MQHTRALLTRCWAVVMCSAPDSRGTPQHGYAVPCVSPQEPASRGETGSNREGPQLLRDIPQRHWL